MSTKKKSDEINPDRRTFLGTAAVTIAAAQLGMFSSTSAEASEAKPGRQGHDQVGSEHLVWLTEADRRWPAEYWLRRSRAPGRFPPRFDTLIGSD